MDFLTPSYDNRTNEIHWRILYSDTRLLLQHQTLIFYINKMYLRIYNIYILHYTHSFFLFHKQFLVMYSNIYTKFIDYFLQFTITLLSRTILCYHLKLPNALFPIIVIFYATLDMTGIQLILL